MKEQNGITLVALIITIIVLLILSVVTIQAISGDTIINHAENARDEYKAAQTKEHRMLGYYESVLDNQKVVPTLEELEEKYGELSYFSSFAKAIQYNNGGENTPAPDATKEDAVAVHYVNEEGIGTILLLKDTVEENIIEIKNNNIVINLGGRKLSLINAAYFNITAGNYSASIDGTLAGSKIYAENTEDSAIFRIYCKNFTINGRNVSKNK